MDLKDKRSIGKFVDIVKRRHNRIDILINNAAVYHKPPASFNKGDIPIHFREVEEIVKTNYLGLKTITEAFVPFLSPGSRIINISSHFAKLKAFSSDDNSQKLVQKLTDPGLRMTDLDDLVKRYVQSIRSGDWSSAGWPDCAYTVTKIAVNIYTRLLQQQLNKSNNKDIIVNALCPGTHSFISSS